VKKTVLVLIIIMLLAAAILQWGLDRTPAGTNEAEIEGFPSASSLLDLLGGARQYVAYVLYIKTDTLHHTYYGSALEEGELVPYFILITLLDPNYISAYYVGAGTIDAQGKRDEAIEFTLQGIRANPESADLYYSLGDLYLEEERYEDAKVAFEKSLQYEPEIVNRNMLISALAATYSALGEKAGQLRMLMERVLTSEIRLLDEDLPYEQQKILVTRINNTLNDAVDIGR
jgi:tetratricopeptide (TPR) repeat protein